MSTCISRHGEFSEHETGRDGADRFTCQMCGVFDEDAALQRIAELEAAQASDTTGQTPATDDMALRLAQARQWIAHKGTGYIPPWNGLTAVEQEQAETEARHWINAAVNAGVTIVPAGRTVVELPEPDGRSWAGSSMWDAEARHIEARIDQQRRPFVRCEGKIWLVSEAEAVGLALVAAAREARRMASESSGDGTGQACCDLHNVHCEPPSELCCHECTEAQHPQHPPGIRCVLESGQDGEPNG